MYVQKQLPSTLQREGKILSSLTANNDFPKQEDLLQPTAANKML